MYSLLIAKEKSEDPKMLEMLADVAGKSLPPGKDKGKAKTCKPPALSPFRCDIPTGRVLGRVRYAVSPFRSSGRSTVRISCSVIASSSVESKPIFLSSSLTFSLNMGTLFSEVSLTINVTRTLPCINWGNGTVSGSAL
jgi:hypothetical protein